jgi:hypothetical protein
MKKIKQTFWVSLLLLLFVIAGHVLAKQAIISAQSPTPSPSPSPTQTPIPTPSPTPTPSPIPAIGNTRHSALTYTRINIDDDPFVFSITDQDQPVKILSTNEYGYAKGFVFSAEAGIDLHSLAYEMDINAIGSYVGSILYGPDGIQIGNVADTRIQFTTATSGDYYLVVYTFGNKVGDVSLQVFDDTFEGIITIINYENGSQQEMNFSYNQSQNSYFNYGNPFNLIFDFQTPVTLSGESVIYFDKQAGTTVTRNLKLAFKDDGPFSGRSLESHTSPYLIDINLEQVNDTKIKVAPSDSTWFFIPGHYLTSLIFSTPGVSSTATISLFEINIPQVCAINPDLNNDNKVNILDYTILINNFMKSGNNIPGNLNCDDKVDILDFTMLMNNFNPFPNSFPSDT